MITREQIVEEARSFIGTPYHLGGRAKGVGVDCGTFLLLVYQKLGLIDDEDLGVYGHDWWLHVKEEKYMLHVLRHAKQMAERVMYRSDNVEPGNMILVHAAKSRVYNHGGIVTQWPMIIHSVHGGVQEADASRHPMWAYHEIVVFDPWNKR